jgi:uncharacterized protein
VSPALLAQRAADAGGPLVVLLPRSPGMREQRWAHLLSGPVEFASSPAPAPVESGAGATDLNTLRAEVARLSAEVAALRARVETLERGASADEH